MTPVKQIYMPNRNQEQWGNWRLKRHNWTLVYELNGYEIDLEEINTCGAMLDWVFQLHAKRWMSIHDMIDLIEAFRDIFDPQANMCSYRGQREINAPRYLRQRYQETYRESCPMCGGPEPCSKRACIDSLSAQADYMEGTIEGSDWKLK